MNEQSNKNIGKIELIILIITIVVSGLISLADLFGLLDGIEWLSNRIGTITLLTVGLLAGYILIERRGKLESISGEIQKLAESEQGATTRIIESLNGVEVQVFDSPIECLKYVNLRLSKAKKQIDDLSWTPEVGKSEDLPPIIQENLKYRRQVQATADRMPYREVFIFNRKSRLEKFLEFLSRNAPGYSCGYFESSNDVPLLQYMIIDSQEVVFLTGDYSFVAFNHPRLVKLFIEYYDDIWNKSIKLKHGNRIFWDNVEKLIGAERTLAIKATTENKKSA